MSCVVWGDLCMLHLQCSWGLTVLPTPAWEYWLLVCTYVPPTQSHQLSHGSRIRAWGAGAGILKGSVLCPRAQVGKMGWRGDWLSPGPLPPSIRREPWMQSPHIPQRQGGPQSWHSVKFLPLTRPEPAKQQRHWAFIPTQGTGVVVFNTQGYLF